MRFDGLKLPVWFGGERGEAGDDVVLCGQSAQLEEFEDGSPEFFGRPDGQLRVGVSIRWPILLIRHPISVTCGRPLFRAGWYDKWTSTSSE
ncbi:hypothetical protein [Dactylosporangium salmoneum]|uniref:Uncharacterized protein n=1 Tax=Dactylosporangium salmoneum TaxID=53361 RepID=A0ABN3GA52_9ACTN